MPTYSSDLLPSSTGIKLGSNSQRWDIFVQNLDISGSLTGPTSGIVLTSPTTIQTVTQPVGTNFSVQAVGLFTGSQMDYGILTETGGAGISSTLFHSSQGNGVFATEALTAGITVPIGSSKYQVDSIAGYAVNNGSTSNVVAGYFYAQQNASNGRAWALNPSVTAAAGSVGANIQGIEVDVDDFGTAAILKGVSVQGPTWNTAPAQAIGYNLGTPGGSSGAQWDYGYLTQAGATTDAYVAGPRATGNNQSSAIFIGQGTNNSGTQKNAYWYTDLSGSMKINTDSGLVRMENSALTGIEIVAPSGLASSDIIWPDSTAHRWKMNNNNGGARTVASMDSLGSVTVDLASVANGASSADSADITVTGAVVGDAVIVTAATALEPGVFLYGRVTAPSTARFQLGNLSGGAVDRASDTYTIRVLR